jgi:uncharacterized protein (TIGR02118 family)
MLKSTFCLYRHPDMSHDQFTAYWREVHAPLVLEVAEVLGITGYRQIHTTHDKANHGLQASRGGPDPYDGIAEAWFADLASALAAFASPQGRIAWERLAEDERRFIDLARSPIFFGEEITIIEPIGAVQS